MYGFNADQHRSATQFVVDWTYVYTMEGLKARGFSVISAKDVVAGNGLKTTSGTEPKGTHVWRATVPDNMGRHHSGTGSTYGSHKFNDWENMSLSNYSVIPNFGAVMYVHSSSKWDYKGHVKINGEAVVTYEVHHWFEVKVCTSDHSSDCKTTRIPKGEADDVTSVLIIPATKAVEEKQREVHHLSAIKLAARHNAELILTAFDAAAYKQ